MEPLLLPGKNLTPVQLTGVKMQEYFETLLGQMERSTVDSMVTTGLALHEMLALCAQSILAQAEATSTRQMILQAAETLRKNYQKERHTLKTHRPAADRRFPAQRTGSRKSLLVCWGGYAAE